MFRCSSEELRLTITTTSIPEGLHARRGRATLRLANSVRCVVSYNFSTKSNNQKHLLQEKRTFHDNYSSRQQCLPKLTCHGHLVRTIRVITSVCVNFSTSCLYNLHGKRIASLLAQQYTQNYHSSKVRVHDPHLRRDITCPNTQTKSDRTHAPTRIGWRTDYIL